MRTAYGVAVQTGLVPTFAESSELLTLTLDGSTFLVPSASFGSGPPRSGDGFAGMLTAGWNQNTGYLLWILFINNATANASVDVNNMIGR